MWRSYSLAGFALAVAAIGCSAVADFPRLDTTPTPTPTPLAEDQRPLALQTQMGLEEVRVTWEAVPDSLAYAVYVSTDSAFTTSAWRDAAFSREEVAQAAAIVPLEAGPATWVRVVAVTGSGETLGLGAIEVAPIARGWAGSVPSTDPSAIWSHAGTTGKQFGLSVAALGDVNGDTFEDLAVGAPATITSDIPFVRIFLGSPAGPVTGVDRSGTANSHFGRSIASPGRVDSDALNDVIVGAPYGLVGPDPFGVVHLYRGSSTPGAVVSATPVANYDGSQGNSRFGHSVTAAGDVNGDDRGDMCIGVPQFDTAVTNPGRWDCHRTSGTFYEASAIMSLSGSAADEQYGNTVAGLGDLDGDGLGDMIVVGPASTYMNGGMSNGNAFVYVGTGTGWGIAGYITGTGINQSFGASVAGGGDINGDSFDDFVIGTPLNGSGKGTAQLFFGRDASPPWQAVPAWVPSVVVTSGSAQFGSTSAMGDVNADGYADVVIGAPTHHGFDGSVNLFLGSPDGLPNVPSLKIRGTYGSAIQKLGTAVAIVDINGDGSRDIVASAAELLADPGDVLIYYGPPVLGPALVAGPPATVPLDEMFSLPDATLAFSAGDARLACTIVWGDGTAATEIEACTQASLVATTHEYAATGDYTVRVTARSLGYGTKAHSLLRVSVTE